MASHVVVIDSAARRATVKTTPNKHLSDVLEEACSKLGLSASNYGLKNNNKQVDLSRTIRLSGLSSGAKLELVQLSKSAGVVSVALQLPESEAQGLPNGRLTDKFASTTTLWFILRKFEAGVAGGGGGAGRNLTAKGAPPLSGSGTAGSGRLYYLQPVVQVMGRELATVTDLQKTLAQLGFNSGSTLLRLTFRRTDTPLEEAMTQIQAYFESVDGSSATTPTTTQQQIQPPLSDTSNLLDGSVNHENSSQIPSEAADPPNPASTETPSQLSTDSPVSQHSSTPLEEAPQSSTTSRPISVFRPPSSSTPSAALTLYNDEDYTPTVEHAQIHQKMLAQSSLNRRLPTEAELAAQADAEAEKWAAVQEVEIKIRFPDESALSVKFGQGDSSADLYRFVWEECLDEGLRGEGFLLRNPGAGMMAPGGGPGARGKAGPGGSGNVIPDDETKKLIRDLRLRGRVLLIFGWDDAKASIKARGTKSVLKPELRARAQEFKLQSVPGMDGPEDDDPGLRVDLGKRDAGARDGEGGGEGKKKLPKWLSKLTKK